MKRQQMNIRHISNPKQSKYPKKKREENEFSLREKKSMNKLLRSNF